MTKGDVKSDSKFVSTQAVSSPKGIKGREVPSFAAYVRTKLTELKTQMGGDDCLEVREICQEVNKETGKVFENDPARTKKEENQTVLTIRNEWKKLGGVVFKGGKPVRAYLGLGQIEVDKPKESNVEVTKPVEAPVETLDETPVETLDETPVETPVETTEDGDKVIDELDKMMSELDLPEE